MDTEPMTALFSVATFACVWLYQRPQQAENKAIHGSMDKLSAAVDKLSDELQASREDRAAMNEQLKTLFKDYKKLSDEVAALRQIIMECRRSDAPCSKK